MNKQHHYNTKVTWTGNTGEGTKSYHGYARSHQLSITNKSVIECSSDPAFAGDATKYNPEELLLASLSSCHMLWYLHLCADNGISVIEYFDNATGTMEENEHGGKFTDVMLQPHVTITDSTQIEKAKSLHAQANKLCFIANSCNFPVRHLAFCKVG